MILTFLSMTLVVVIIVFIQTICYQMKFSVQQSTLLSLITHIYIHQMEDYFNLILHFWLGIQDI
jgi:hypothetical protein